MIKIKPLIENFLAPEYKTANSAGFDIYVQEKTTLTVGINNVVKLGFASELPEGYVALLLPRSGVGIKGIGLRNTVGVIDSDYRGEWIANITIDEQGDNGWGDSFVYKRGDRLLQCIVVPVSTQTIELTDDLSTTDRGEGGFGSTGA